MAVLKLLILRFRADRLRLENAEMSLSLTAPTEELDFGNFLPTVPIWVDAEVSVPWDLEKRLQRNVSWITKRRGSVEIADVASLGSDRSRDKPRIPARNISPRQDLWQDRLAGIFGSHGDDERRAVGTWHFRGMRDANTVDDFIHLAPIDVVTTPNGDILSLQPAEPSLARLTDSPQVNTADVS